MTGAASRLKWSFRMKRFVDFIETNGLDLTDEEKDSIREAKADREAGRMEKFVSLEDLEKELGI